MSELEEENKKLKQALKKLMNYARLSQYERTQVSFPEWASMVAEADTLLKDKVIK